MPKYAVLLGGLDNTVMLEAANAQQALDNVLTLVQSHGVVMIPKEDVPESHWFSRNTSDAKDEVVVKDTNTARKMVARVRKDVVDVFWFVSLQHEKKNKTKRIK